MASATIQPKNNPPEDEPLPEGAGLDAAAEPDEPDVVLALSDLILDANREVVLFNDSGLRSIAVDADAAVVAEGQAGRHVTAAGEDVSGFRYLAFDNGLKLYYQPGLNLVLVRKSPAKE
jgi:hypothetical protein